MSELETKQEVAPIEQDWGSRNHVHTLVLMLATVVGLYLCYKIALPFISILVWALTLAVMFTPLQLWLESKLKHPNFAALISILLIGLIVIVPILLIGEQLLTQVVKGSQLIESKINSGEWQRVLETQPHLASIVSKIEQYINFPEAIKALNAKLGNTAGAIVRGSIFQVIGLVLVFYMLFFLLRDRFWALQSIAFLSPLSQAEMHKLYKRVAILFTQLFMARLQLRLCRVLWAG